jgi:hypothetical protein
MKPERSLALSQEPTTFSYHEPEQASPNLPTDFFQINSNIIPPLSSHPCPLQIKFQEIKSLVNW